MLVNNNSVDSVPVGYVLVIVLVKMLLAVGQILVTNIWPIQKYLT